MYIVSCFEVSVILRCFLGLSYKLSCVDSFIVDNLCLLMTESCLLNSEFVPSMAPVFSFLVVQCLKIQSNGTLQHVSHLAIRAVKSLPASPSIANQIGVEF